MISGSYETKRMPGKNEQNWKLKILNSSIKMEDRISACCTNPLDYVFIKTSLPGEGAGRRKRKVAGFAAPTLTLPRWGREL